MTDQLPTRGVSTQAILRKAAFAAGVDDVRAGKPPNYDAYTSSQREDHHQKVNDHWAYERGRQWASLAPVSMPLRIDGKLNPKAVALADVAFGRRYII